jgi:hypothetical protein
VDWLSQSSWACGVDILFGMSAALTDALRV